jgi:hypothetical protein
VISAVKVHRQACWAANGAAGGTRAANCVLRFAADFPLLGHFLGRQAHAVGNADVLVVVMNMLGDK